MNLKNTLLTTFVICHLTSIGTYAQETNTFKGWEIGVDAMSLIDKNEYPAISVFLLRGIGQNGISLRSRLGFSRSSFQNLTSRPGEFPRPDDKLSREIFGLIGIQKEVVKDLGVGKNSSLYTGLDFGMSYKEDFTKRLFLDFETLFFYEESKFKYNTFTASPFLGVCKDFGNNFSIRIEMAILFQRTDFNFSSKTIQVENYDPSIAFVPPPLTENNSQGVGYGKNRTNSIKTSPINQVLLTYKF